MRRITTLSLTTVVAFGMTGASASLVHAAPSAASGSVQTAAKDTSQAKKSYDRIVKLLPADWQQRQAAAFKKLGIERSPQQEMALSKIKRAAKARLGGQRAINPDDYDCGPTKLDGYVDSILADVDPMTLYYLSLTGALDVPAYDAILFGKQGEADYKVPSHEKQLRTTLGYAKRFWDVPLNDVQLLGMDTNVFGDLNKITRVVQFMYGVGPADATEIAQEIQTTVNSEPALDGGKNPLFTLNAFAFTGKGDPDPVVRKVPDRVIFGEGILKALKATGNDAVGPKAVLSHEMSHHVQYEIGTFDTGPDGPEGTRRTELMADSFGTYFGAHKKGLNANPKQLLGFQSSFYDVGDCSFTSAGHHGTPNQRRAASAWGLATAAYANNPNRVIPSVKLQERFEKILPDLVAPDAPTSISAYKAKAKAAS